MIIKEAMEISKGEFIFDESETADSIMPEPPADSSIPPDYFLPENADDIQDGFEPHKQENSHHGKSRSPSWWSEDYKQALSEFEMADEEWKRLEQEHLEYRAQLGIDNNTNLPQSNNFKFKITRYTFCLGEDHGR